MEKYKLEKYGPIPYTVVVVHGGPGAAGSVAPMARNLSETHGVLEPHQTSDSVNGQTNELKSTIEENANGPVVLVGHSWGAMLSTMATSQYPSLVKKLILVGSGVFEKKYAHKISGTRMNRLNADERKEVEAYIHKFNNPNDRLNDNDFSRLGTIFTKADIYHPIDSKLPDIDARFDIYKKVWPEAEKLRNEGTLLEMTRSIECPVVAIHGDYDPHPSEGVKIPLTKTLKSFKFILLKKCGHYPWLEKYAKEKFFRVLEEEIH
jgi:pimeloyl-ACP methyl ester carboxylesterase